MSALPRPERAAGSGDQEPVSGDGYRLEYALRGPPGEVALQRVTTRIRYLKGEAPLLAYEGHYYEYFRFAADGSLGRQADGRPQVDVHGFGLMKDGWQPQDVLRLTRRLRLPWPAWTPGGTVVECLKRFHLGPGEVEGQVDAWASEDGAGFGLLASGPEPQPAARLTVFPPGQADQREIPLEPLQLRGVAVAGSGTWTGWAWRAEERFRYVLATQEALLEADPYGPGHPGPRST